VLNKHSFLLITALIAVPALAQARVASSQDIEVKVSLESLMERRLETVLRKVLGTDDVFVVVNAELLADSARPDVEVLPGVTVKKIPASPAPLEMPASLVRRITVSVFVPHAMSDENRDLAQKTAARMIGLKPERGDVLNVEKLAAPTAVPGTISAAMPEPASRLGRFLDQLLRPAVLLLLVWLIAAVAGLLLVARRFFDPLIGVLRDAAQSLHRTGSERSVATAKERESEVAAKTPAAAEPAPAKGGDAPERRLPFSFIREKDMPALEMLLQEQSDITAAVIVHYLPPALASRALAAMTAPIREKVLVHLSNPAVLDHSDVGNIEDAILSKIDYILGGEDKIVAILDQAPISMQNEILSIVSRNDPAFGKRVGQRVVLLDDIGLLEEADLTVLSRQANVRGMAVVLKYLPHLREKILPKLKSGLGEWLAQETALVGDISEPVKEAEMRRVLQAFTALVREGKIVLRKGEAAAPRSFGDEHGAGAFDEANAVNDVA
jgi:flagellar motor switch protein FliG